MSQPMSWGGAIFIDYLQQKHSLEVSKRETHTELMRPFKFLDMIIIPCINIYHHLIHDMVHILESINYKSERILNFFQVPSTGREARDLLHKISSTNNCILTESFTNCIHHNSISWPLGCVMSCDLIN